MKSGTIAGYCVVGLLWLYMSCASSFAEEAVFLVKLEESRTAVQGDELRKGLDVVDRRLQVDNLSMWYHRLVDPQQGDQVKSFTYGDYFMNCRFGGFGNGGWDMEYFIQVEVGYPGGPSWNVIQDVLQQGMYVLEQRDRALVELVWPVPPPPLGQGTGGEVSVCLAKWPEATKWAYLQVDLHAIKGGQLRRVRVSGYPGNTSGPPERERFAKTVHQDGNLQTGATLELDPAREWAVAMYNQHAQTEDANLAVFLPEEVQAARVSGTYSVGLDLVPAAGRNTVHIALGFYTGTPFEQGNATFLEEAGRVREALAGVNWQPDFVRMVDLEQLTKEYEPLLQLAGVRERMGAEVDGLIDEVRQLQQALMADAEAEKPLDRMQVIELTRKINAIRGLRERLYEAAVQALVDTL